MNIFKLTASASAPAMSGLLCTGAFAQSLDYDMMGEVFGEPVTLGATGAPQRASDVPATMIIIIREDLDRFAENDIPGVLRHYAGMNVQRYSLSDAQVSIRGAATPYTPRLLDLLNGREVYLSSYGYTAWNSIPVQFDEIQQIEIVKCPQSALYGFNAVAGVVNIITRNPSQENYVSGHVNAGDGGYSEGSMSAGFALSENCAVRASLGTSEADEFAIDPTRVDQVNGAAQNMSRRTAAVEALWSVTESINLGFEATYSELGQREPNDLYQMRGNQYELSSYKFDLEADTGFGFITGSAYVNDSSIGAIETTGTVVSLEDLFKIGTHDTVRVSGEFRTSSQASYPDTSNGDIGYDGWAVSAMWNHKFSPVIDMTLAARYDRTDWERDGDLDPTIYPYTRADYDVSHDDFTYNAALVWHPDEASAVRLSTGRGIQAPALFDVGFTTAFFGTAITGNPNL